MLCYVRLGFRTPVTACTDDGHGGSYMGYQNIKSVNVTRSDGLISLRIYTCVLLRCNIRSNALVQWLITILETVAARATDTKWKYGQTCCRVSYIYIYIAMHDRTYTRFTHNWIDTAVVRVCCIRTRTQMYISYNCYYYDYYNCELNRYNNRSDMSRKRYKIIYIYKIVVTA